THGSDEVWQNFSVQWDGYVQIVSPHTGLTLGSDNGSRMWIDVNRDGQFDSSGPEYINNAWGFTPNFIKTQSTALLSPGVYPVRIQFAVDQLNAFELIAHSPPVVRVAYIVPSNPLRNQMPCRCFSRPSSGCIDFIRIRWNATVLATELLTSRPRPTA